MILVHVTTVPETFGFFRGQISFMKERKFEVHAVSSPGAMLAETAIRENIPVHPIEMSRRITPLADLLALTKLRRLFLTLKPAIVHAHTPKGGVLGTLAARMAGVPIVIYGMRGLPFVTAKGVKRLLLSLSETISCLMADRIFAVSFSIRQTVVRAGICPGNKIHVLAKGSSNGVDSAGRFNPEKLPAGIREEIRQRYRIPLNSLVIGYVGRIVKDKGIVELEEAWQSLRYDFPDVYLLMVGVVEPQDPVPPAVMARLEEDPRVRLTGGVKEMAPLYAAMDILVLPTHREGFPNTPLEAAAMQLPVVATKADGCAEAVVDAVTGFLVEPVNSQELAGAIRVLLRNPQLRKEMGDAGRLRAERDFNPEKIWHELYENYLELLKIKLRSYS